MTTRAPTTQAFEGTVVLVTGATSSIGDLEHATEEREQGSATMNEESGIIDRPSAHSVDETVQRLEGMLRSKGVTLFAVIDHSGEAEKVGMKMPPTRLLIFGSPKAGTPLMLAAPRSGLDLPLKILIWEDAAGRVTVSFNSPSYLQRRHALPPEQAQVLASVEALAAAAAA
jgi:uncharacterized protein (DUF302 family)